MKCTAEASFIGQRFRFESATLTANRKHHDGTCRADHRGQSGARDTGTGLGDDITGLVEGQLPVPGGDLGERSHGTIVPGRAPAGY